MRSLIAAVALNFPALALAADTEFVAHADKEKVVTEPPWLLSAEVGGAWTSGNTETWTVNGASTFARRWEKDKLGAVAAANIGQSISDADGDTKLSAAERATGYQESARKYSLDARYDRFLSDHDSLYVLAGAMVDPFAGYDLRTHEQLGYAHIFTKTPETVLRAEVGADYAQENYVEGIDPNYKDILAARVMVGVTHKFNEQVSISETIEAYENVIDYEDIRVLNDFGFNAKVSDKFSIKISHKLAFDNVPVEGFQTFDQTSMVTLVASII